ncbi:CubicO group peptidase, beta-lactamase class C family [Paenimyroides aquimaris]|uniref:CubicO group peptidase, beta-lactamase class C family n=1 Tax=Paenimyroides marinum TaxID=1159016 RepID=A0A1H6M703_9FLAO|nr:serine hydrolase [Paenimyroides aquimaris]SEH97136.1 CubicO group peptidase, beta-lactamase class C family [Paenimyroides aquimaris]
MKKVLKWFLVLLAAIVALIYIFDLGYLVRAVRVTYLTGHKTAFLEDYTYFDNREIKAGTPQPWNISKDYNKVKPTERLEQTHKELQTTSFLVIKNDSIWHESYYDIGTVDSKTNSFSMAKSIVTSALGKAIDLGMIQSLDTKVIDFLPELTGKFAKEVTVGDLASMASGQHWDENYYGPTSVTTQAYFKTDLRSLMLSLPIDKKPGQEFIYQSGDTQLLAMVLEKATKMNLADFVSKYFWQPMGMEHDAIWQIDYANDGIEKAYCCVASNARDFAKFGKLYIQDGMWNGQQILSSEYIHKSINPRFKESPQYGYGWWLSDYKDKQIYYMRGHLGQFVIVIPEDELIIVRLGHIKGLQTETDPHSNDLYIYIDETYLMLDQKL